MNESTKAVINVWYGQYIPIDINNELDWDESFQSNYPNPEELTIIKNEFEHLSKEAQEVVSLIYNAPYTILQLLSTRKREAITVNSIENFLIESGWPRPRIKRVFKELKNFSTNL
jgi:hypothetical protein